MYVDAVISVGRWLSECVGVSTFRHVQVLPLQLKARLAAETGSKLHLQVAGLTGDLLAGPRRDAP